MYKEFIKRYKTFKNWWQFMPPFNKQQFNVVARLRAGPKVLIKDLHSVDYATVVAIGGEDSYRLSEIKDPSVVVDVGAHIGTFSLLMAEKYPHAKIYAIEPEKENYKQLLANIKLNRYDNIQPLNVAIGSDYGTTPFFVSKNSVAHSVIDQGEGGTAEIVETIPLSKFQNIDVLKFDAEGAEYLVKEIPPVSYIAIEVHKLPGKHMGKLIEDIESKFHIIKKEVEKTGHITLVGVTSVTIR